MNNMTADPYSETQAFEVWGYFALGIAACLSLGSLALPPHKPVWIWLWAGAAMSLAFNLLCMRTLITGSKLSVIFGVFPLYRRDIALADITSAEAVTYSPLAEYGGWGIRCRGKNAALNARGNQGVRLTLHDGRRILIGSQHPEALAAALTERC